MIKLDKARKSRREEGNGIINAERQFACCGHCKYTGLSEDEIKKLQNRSN
jgi:hypothetical protein